jgi:putative endonuclease
MTYFCYILKCADGTYYTGWSTDPQQRLVHHNAGKGARYTRSRRPVRLVYIEEQPDRSSAMRREASIKKLQHTQKQALVEEFIAAQKQGASDPNPNPE